MSIFWVVAALLLAGALLMLLPPLWKPGRPLAQPSANGVNLSVYRDQVREAEQDLDTGLIAPEQLAQVRSDIQRRLLDDTAEPPVRPEMRTARRTALLLALLIPTGSVVGYLALGDPPSLTASARSAVPGPENRHAITQAQIESMVTALAERLRSDADNVEGWAMLARSYSALGRYRDAVIAFRRATQLAPADAGLLADFADVLGMAQGKRLAGEPAGLIQRALDANPRHVKALALAGSVSFELRDYAAARGYWERLIGLVPADSDIARSIQGSIGQARQLEGAGSGVDTVPSVAQSAVADAKLSVSGDVVVSPALEGRIASGDTLFVFARAAQGPRMPLAIIKRPVGAWPSGFVLDDAMAMAPGLKLSGFAQVIVTARISRSGAATPQPGDLVGHSEAIVPGAKDLRITIDRIEP